MAAGGTALAKPGAASQVWRWVMANFGSSWFLLGPLLAAYAPRRLFQTYFNLFLRRHARRLLNFVDPYVSIDFWDCPPVSRYAALQPLASAHDTTYEEVKAYLSSSCSEQDARELRAEGAKEGDGLVLSLNDGQDVADEFRGATLWWSSVPADELVVAHAAHHGQQQNTDHDGRRCQRLTFHRRHRRLVVDEYLPHVRRRGRDILFANRRRRLYTNNRTTGYSSAYDKTWSFVNFDHPTTFDTLAMDPDRKKEIMDDLDAFRNNREFYRRTGKPWKRGYLLYGPPGTGKSTMIAAMANYLNYDIYDVELTVVSNNNDLRKLLIQTTSKSIIIIEDIDCSLDLTGKRDGKKKPAAPTSPYELHGGGSEVTLSGLLNFIDGLWSACGGERIVVFTTNHVDQLDPALIRRGRMDMHIEMSYCGFEAFKTLAKNYLDIHAHRLFPAVEEQLNEVELTPADVAECLMTAKRAGYGEDAALEFLIQELKKKGAETKAAAEAAAAAEEAVQTNESEADNDDDDEYEYEEDAEDVEEEDDPESVIPADISKYLVAVNNIAGLGDLSSIKDLLGDIKKKRADAKEELQKMGTGAKEAAVEANLPKTENNEIEDVRKSKDART
ncbi:hypothetical protein PR202_gb12576 [Eleusine coracana subsp. coracana]|uniref:AAA+ ATPase domain-containing protein n=1 Tax=Eleusine coracana subsp. coracana TaxID=191504 RepID=A0AAV5ERF9_ELECO|nr:hypothetical protein QOZ80_7BG0590680 [Eleusine coracana subsp. coracana]GJN24810.1 hypothetical protein PR202_gb12576 [Eleusine coracana subsp. coracana]